MLFFTLCGTISFCSVTVSAFADTLPPGTDLTNENIPNTPVLPELYGRLPGFRVQMLADSSWSEARDHYYQAQTSITLPLHLEYHDPWWKIMAGDFSSREEAARARHLLTTGGWSDAWIVNSPVIVAGPIAATAEPEPQLPVVSFYTIQVAALRDTLYLAEHRRNLGTLIVLQTGDSFNICVGDFERRSDAAAVLSGVRQQYPEAFIRKARITR